VLISFIDDLKWRGGLSEATWGKDKREVSKKIARMGERDAHSNFSTTTEFEVEVSCGREKEKASGKQPRRETHEKK